MEIHKYEFSQTEIKNERGAKSMDTFWTIVIILVILWAVGFFALPSIGALIHILLVIAVIVIVYRLLTGRHVLSGQKR